MEAPPIILWAPPRSCSTAFERAIVEHPQVAVSHEAFGDCFYFGPDRKQPPLAEAEAALEKSQCQRNTTYATQMAALLGAAGENGKPFSFSKELSTYYQPSKLGREAMRRFRHCFLIRSPEKV